MRGSSELPRTVSDVLKGLTSTCAKLTQRSPLWDLFLVLDSLRSPPFEPISQADRKFLTLKTVFLVALASGRRCSEVNGLSGLDRDVSKLSNGSFELAFLPEFRAKNQNFSDPSPKVVVPPLSSILAPDDEDIVLCPVRALDKYLTVTAPHRPLGCRKLFLSVNQNYNKDVSKNTISRWLSEVIRFAYQRAGIQLPSSRAHEIRAWSASIAAAKNMPLLEIMRAAYWKSENTFINFYLRDCALTRSDGTHGISAVVASQRALQLH